MPIDILTSNLKKSFLSSTIAEMMTLPIQVIKTNQQNTNQRIIPLVKNIWKNNGIIGFYRSSPFSILSQVLNTSFKFSIYRYLGQYIENKSINGMLTGISVSLFTHPIDYVKIHLQMNDRPFFRNCYNGYSKSFIKASINGMLFFPLTDYLKEEMKDQFHASLLSISIVTVIIHPIDYLKTMHIYGNFEKIRFYYRGITLNLIRTIFHFTILMKSIDHLN